MVLEDVLNDVLDTERIYLKQVDIAKNKTQQFNLIKGHMDALLATTEMEYNGIKIDLVEFNKNKKELEKNLELVYNETSELANLYWR